MGDWKAIRIPMVTGPIRLYDLASDLGERHDLAAAHPDLVRETGALMDYAHVPSPLWQVGAPANPN